MNKRLLLSIFLISVMVSGFAQDAPKYSNDFLSIGAGARAFGMSNCVIATSGDVTAAYWNPAGLVNNPLQYDIGLMHAEYFAGILKYDYLGGSYKVNDSTSLGFSVIRLGVDDIQDTRYLFDQDGNIDFDRIRSFSVADYAFIFSYAKKSKIEGFNYGANVKIIYRKQGEFANAYGFGLDAGVQYNRGKWHVGAMAMDVTSTFSAWTYNTEEVEEIFIETGNEIPENGMEITLPRLRLGFARDFSFSEKVKATAEIDADFTFDKKRHVLVEGDPVSIDPRFGVEVSYLNLIYLRMGIGDFQKVRNFDDKTDLNFQPNIGLGVKLFNFSIDYALTDIGDNSIAPYSNVFSLRYTFDRK